uniref:collagen alpha-1(I) chain-like isoform X1 n=1 Tax=Gasterosteus aculeatus aculeatus TaxID=481459 RepID=UPI001A99C349|nr:collagen alpha-1(I) chain-like isoform X1 [Gasterosteus aculeatus aculeatus]
MTSSEKETSRRAVDQNGCQSNPGETNPTKGVPRSDLGEPPHRVPTRTNGQRREPKRDQETEGQGKKNEEPALDDGMDTPTELKSTNESEEPPSGHKVAPKNKRRRRAGSKRRAKRPSGVALKIVLQKNPVKEKQWVSLSPSGDRPGAPCPQAALEETAQILKNATLGDARQKEGTNAPSADLDDPSDAGASSPPSWPGAELRPGRAAMPPGSNNEDGDALSGSPPSPHGEAKVDVSRSAREAGPSDSPAAAGSEVETGPEDAVLQTSGGGTEGQGSADEGNSAAGGAAPLSGSIKSSAASICVVAAPGKVNSEGVLLVLPAEQEGAGDTGLPAEPRPHLLRDVHGGPSPPCGRQPPPLAKHLERTLKLVAISPSQPVKRPGATSPPWC